MEIIECKDVTVNNNNKQELLYVVIRQYKGVSVVALRISLVV